MKKISAVLLAVIISISCLCLSGCGLVFGFFNDVFDNGDGGDDGSHTHQFDSYFTYSKCSVAGCNVIGRNQSEDTYAKEFKYSLTTTKINQIRALYDEMTTYLADGGDYEQFATLYDQYLEYFDYVNHQYQVASILSDVSYTTTTERNLSTVSKLYNEMFENYYGLYKSIYESEYREEFFDGWSSDEIEQALYYAEIYGGSADNNNAVDDVISKYEEYMDGINWTFATNKTTLTRQLNKVGEIYGELVAANNNVAKSMDYDNYMYYAYENEYNRNYTPDDVATMRQYVKTYVAPLLGKLARAYQSFTYFNASADQNYYLGLMSDSLFAGTSDVNFNRVRTTIDYVGDYFNYMQMSALDTGGQKFDFYGAANDLFKNGNYFTGEYEGAYTWWIDKISAPILFFGPSYDTAFTFVHEFGHYYENVYNGSLKLSYDHDETHSQGNEMLFLAWLAANKPKGVTNGFDIVEIEQLFNMVGNVVISTAVDEFEQAAYAGEYNGQKITTDSYGELFKTILNSYGGADAWLESTYWAYVVFDNSAYYISYAMSALPSIELYVKGRSDLASARDSYVKLFTFANGFRFVGNDRYGNAYLKANATYEAILNYCGLQGPFQLGLYTTLSSYFNSRADLR